MLHAATDLMRYKAVVENEGLPITDLFFSPDLSTLTYLAVRKSNAPWAEHGVVSVRHFGVPAADCREIHFDATEEALQDSPEIEPGSVIEALAQRIAGEEKDHDSEVGAEIKAVFERATDWIGSPVTHEGDTIGQLDDFLIEWPRPRVAQIVVNTGVDFPMRQVALPTECYEVPCHHTPSIRLIVDRDTLVDSPEIEKVDALDRHWLDKVRTYYSLPL